MSCSMKESVQANSSPTPQASEHNKPSASAREHHFSFSHATLIYVSAHRADRYRGNNSKHTAAPDPRRFDRTPRQADRLSWEDRQRLRFALTTAPCGAPLQARAHLHLHTIQSELRTSGNRLPAHA